jgi:hypothetical protein
MILLQAHLDTTAVPCPMSRPWRRHSISNPAMHKTGAQAPAQSSTRRNTFQNSPSQTTHSPLHGPRHRDTEMPRRRPRSRSPPLTPCPALPIPHPCTVESRLGPGPSFSTDKGRQTSLLSLPLPLGPDQACHVAGAVGAMGESCACDKAGAHGGQVGDANGDAVVHCTLHTRSSRAAAGKQPGKQPGKQEQYPSVNDTAIRLARG